MEQEILKLQQIITTISDSFPNDNDLKGFLGISKELIINVLNECKQGLESLKQYDNHFETIVLKRDMSELFDKMNEDIVEGFEKIKSSKFNALLKRITRCKFLIREAYISIINTPQIRTEEEVSKANEELNSLRTQIDALKNIPDEITALKEATIKESSNFQNILETTKTEFTKASSELETEINTIKSSTKDTADTIDKELKEIKNLTSEKSNTIIENLTGIQNNAAKIIADFENIKKDQQQYYDQKQLELKVITDSLTTVSQQKNEVDSIFKNVSISDSEIRAIQKNHSELFESLKAQKEQQDKDYKVLINAIEGDESKLQNILDNGQKKIDYFESLEKFILEKQNEIIELGALAAGAALGGTFGLRKGEIYKDLKFWRLAVPSITVLALVWVLIAFTCLKSTTDNITISLILNLAKTIPAFVLMGFVFKQYNKERTLQEEYAFKAAIANTIKAYSDLLHNEDRQENKSRQDMLIKAIERVSSPPKLYHESNSKIFSFSTKYLSESIKNLNDTVKTLLGKD